jgi:hypothetical protein
MSKAFVCVKGTVVNSKAITEEEWLCVPGIRVSTGQSHIFTDFFGNFTISEAIDHKKGQLVISFTNDDEKYQEITKPIVLDPEANFQNTTVLVKLKSVKHK